MVENHAVEIVVAGRPFAFELCRKRQPLGDVTVDHWWMDTRRLYGQRGRSASLGGLVVDYFWALCRQQDATDDPEVRESYALARLLPMARSNGARRIVSDGRTERGGPRESKAERLRDLEQMIRLSRREELTFAAFRDRTADTLGPPPLDAEAEDCYRTFIDELLGEVRTAPLVDGELPLDDAVRRWTQAFKAWGRRAGFAVQKRVLDVVSYECRAALHRCYSAVWWDLLPRLAERHGLDRPTLHFLYLWHLDHMLDAEQDLPALFHLFHGHVFGLHPAGADLIATKTGRALVGDWLTGPDHRAAFGRLLHAYSIACHAYVLGREEAAEDRQTRFRAVGGLDGFDPAEDDEEDMGRGRRRHRPDFDDDF